MLDVEEINRQLNAGKIEVATNQKGVLSLRCRIAVWRAMLDIDNSEWFYWTRINLNSLCVRHVQGVRYQAFPGNPGIDNILKLSHAVAEGAVDPGQAQGKPNLFFHDVLFDTEFDETIEPAIRCRCGNERSNLCMSS